jgi:hypothetical protein
VALVQNSVSLRFPDATASITSPVIFSQEPLLLNQKSADLIAAEQADFLEAIRLKRQPAIPGSEGRRSIALIEACYAERRLWKLPWVEVQPAAVTEVAR